MSENENEFRVVSAGELNAIPILTVRAGTGSVDYKVADPPKECNITFHNESEQVGELNWDDGVMRFEGKADESAQIFFDSVSNLWNEHYGN